MTSKVNILFAKWWKKCQDNTSWQQQIHLEERTHHDVKKFVMTSKGVSWHQIVCHVIKNFHNVETFTMTSNMLDTLCFLWRHYDVIKSSWMILKSQFTRTSKCSSWCQNTSWGQTVRHYFKEFAMTSTRRQRVKKFVIASTDLSWC